MIQRIDEKDGHMFLYFGEPPACVGPIAFVSCLAYQGERILFCRWRETGEWVLPGGRLDPNETAEAAARRELLEETGATLKTLQVLCYIHCFMFGESYWGIAYFGEIERLGSPTDLEEVSEARLFSAFPENRSASGPFANQNRALYLAAKGKFQLAETG